MRLLFLLFIVLPIVELWLLFKVGGAIGFLPTLALTVAIGALGAQVLRRKGFGALFRTQERPGANAVPGQEIVEGFLISVAGGLLLIPGFITDAIAIVLLLPLTRRALLRRLLRSGNMTEWTQQSGAFTFMHMGGMRTQDTRSTHDIFEGEFTRETPPATPLAGPDSDKDER